MDDGRGRCARPARRSDDAGDCTGWNGRVLGSDDGPRGSTVAHLIGICGGLAIVYYADDIRRRTAGSTLSSSMQFVEVGTVLFVLVFLGMEADHLFGVRLWYFAVALAQLWYMITLAIVVLLYTAAYRTLVTEMGA